MPIIFTYDNSKYLQDHETVRMANYNVGYHRRKNKPWHLVLDRMWDMPVVLRPSEWFEPAYQKVHPYCR